MTGNHYPERSQATTVLVLGILSIVVCGVLGPVAWVMGNRELAAIEAGRRRPDDRGTATAGRILGIVGTGFLGLGLLLLLFVLALFATGAFDSDVERIGEELNAVGFWLAAQVNSTSASISTPLS